MNETTITTVTALQTFEEWTAENRRDIEWAAVDYLDTFGLTGDVSRIVREHTWDIVNRYPDEGLEFTEYDVERFVDDRMYEYETYDGPTRAALVHWAWNSDMDVTEFGPLEGEKVWQTIEYIAADNISSAAYAGLRYAVNGYREYLEEFETEDEDNDGE